ncbi:MAG: SiaC family regulatory phosphoprotein, partial [Bacteroidales bacterium]|nr:SiaC family regulatory phosphoprotein [Bacteroidales bacterium]
EKRKIILNIKLIYFNTSTSKCLLDIFEILKKYQEANGEIEINWYYDKDDPDMVEEINDFENEAELNFNIIEF